MRRFNDVAHEPVVHVEPVAELLRRHRDVAQLAPHLPLEPLNEGAEACLAHAVADEEKVDAGIRALDEHAGKHGELDAPEAPDALGELDLGARRGLGDERLQFSKKREIRRGRKSFSPDRAPLRPPPLLAAGALLGRDPRRADAENAEGLEPLGLGEKPCRPNARAPARLLGGELDARIHQEEPEKPNADRRDEKLLENVHTEGRYQKSAGFATGLRTERAEILLILAKIRWAGYDGLRMDDPEIAAKPWERLALLLVIGGLAAAGIFSLAPGKKPEAPGPGERRLAEGADLPASPAPLESAEPAGPQTPAVAPAPAPLPARVSHAVPFSPQAPFGNWSQPYQDACEEASVAMAMAWVRGEASLPPERARDEILDAVAFEDYNFGYHRDTALRETAKLITHLYGYPNISIAYDISTQDIKRELAVGNIAIVPASGLVLQNPHYTVPPAYHMVVVTGYDDAAGAFIVNDPGTKRGAGWRYSYQTLERAIHDWTGNPQTILEGRSGMIVVRPVRGLDD